MSQLRDCFRQLGPACIACDNPFAFLPRQRVTREAASWSGEHFAKTEQVGRSVVCLGIEAAGMAWFPSRRVRASAVDRPR